MDDLERSSLLRILSYVLQDKIKKTMGQSLIRYIEEIKPKTQPLPIDEQVILNRLIESDVVYFGETHNSKRIINENFRLFRAIYNLLEVKQPTKKVALCLEIIPRNIDTSKYLNGSWRLRQLFSEISKEEGIFPQERITGKVYRKEYYKDILKYCKKYQIKVLGIDARDISSIAKRDYISASIIAKTAKEFESVVVMGGDYHMHPLHLPRMVERINSNIRQSYVLTDFIDIIYLKKGFYADRYYKNLFYRKILDYKEFFNCNLKILGYALEGRMFVDYEELNNASMILFNRRLWLGKKQKKYLENIAPIEIVYKK